MASGSASEVNDWQVVEHPAINDWQDVGTSSGNPNVSSGFGKSAMSQLTPGNIAGGLVAGAVPQLGLAAGLGSTVSGGDPKIAKANIKSTHDAFFNSLKAKDYLGAAKAIQDGLLGQGLKEPVDQIESQINAGNYEGAAGTALGFIAPALLGHGIVRTVGALADKLSGSSLAKFAFKQATKLVPGGSLAHDIIAPTPTELPVNRAGYERAKSSFSKPGTFANPNYSPAPKPTQTLPSAPLGPPQPPLGASDYVPDTTSADAVSKKSKIPWNSPTITTKGQKLRPSGTIDRTPLNGPVRTPTEDELAFEQTPQVFKQSIPPGGNPRPAPEPIPLTTDKRLPLWNQVRGGGGPTTPNLTPIPGKLPSGRPIGPLPEVPEPPYVAPPSRPPGGTIDQTPINGPVRQPTEDELAFEQAPRTHKVSELPNPGPTGEIPTGPTSTPLSLTDKDQAALKLGRGVFDKQDSKAGEMAKYFQGKGLDPETVDPTEWAGHEKVAGFRPSRNPEASRGRVIEAFRALPASNNETPPAPVPPVADLEDTLKQSIKKVVAEKGKTSKKPAPSPTGAVPSGPSSSPGDVYVFSDVKAPTTEYMRTAPGSFASRAYGSSDPWVPDHGVTEGDLQEGSLIKKKQGKP